MKYTLSFKDINKTKLPLVGGKGANLGELAGIKNIQVPGGFCITTEAYKLVTEGNEHFNDLLNELALLRSDDRTNISTVAKNIRALIERIAVPVEIANEVAIHLRKMGVYEAYAVRSSATAEDLPAASFAGQQDTFLNVIGKESILKHISKCWASLFTERAVSYRIQNGYSHKQVQLSVVIQKMISPLASGILFTADPVTSNRKVLSIDASFGLGEALVSGIVNADNYKLRDGKIIEKKIADKKLAIYALKDGGTQKQEIDGEKQRSQTLTDVQILELGRIGRDIEAYFGSPQDIEWCLADSVFYIVQSRPITTLFPVPEVNDNENHVYVSTGHQQMMTDPIKPLGMSFFRMTAGRYMPAAGGRLFVDITQELSSPSKREMMVNVLGKSDPFIRGALTNILDRGDFIKTVTEEVQPGRKHALPDYNVSIGYDAQLVPELIARNQAAIRQLEEDIQTKHGLALFDFIRESIKKNAHNPQSFEVIMTAMNSAYWLNDKMNEWLGEKNAADTIAQSVPNNITSEMGLDLLHVADGIRPYPEVISYLQSAVTSDFMDGLTSVKGGREVREALSNFLSKYGMRCAGEIDITRPRWAEQPTMLIPAILNNIRNFEPGEGERRFEQGLNKALDKEQELLKRVRQLPDGAQKAEETKRMIELVRNYSGYREYPKYSIVSRYYIYKKALLKEAELMVEEGVFRDKEDMYYLSFDELEEVVRTHQFDRNIIAERKEAYRLYEKLTPPRVLTSDGEVVAGKYNIEALPGNAIPGLAVSSGIIEGRARVILNMEYANLEEGDILVTTFTDPSWTPLFVSIKGLVTEVGGLMTHGAVIAREYGLPAVVGVEHATRLIKDGQRIRVNGTDGYIELL